MSKSEFRFRLRFQHRNSNSDFDFGIGISIPTLEFQPTFFTEISQNLFLFWLFIGISISTVEIEIEIPITFDNFDHKFRQKSKLSSIGIPIEIPTKLISVETLVVSFTAAVNRFTLI
jgi:hypothetical protein